MTSEAPMNVSKTIEKETTNDRLADFKSRLKTSDIIISLHMGLGVSSVTSHMPHKSKEGKLIKGRSISIDWLNKFAEAFPFIDKSYMLDGKGEMFKRWSNTEQASFVHSTEWYKSKDKTTTKPHSVYASQELVDKALKNKPFLEILIGIYEKSFGSGKIPTEVNIDICQRIRAIRESQEGLSGGSKCTQEDFAKMLNVTRSMIVSIELARQSPSTHFIQRLGHDFSGEPGMGLKQNGKSVRVSYDWLFDGKGEMFQLHGIDVDDDKESMKEEIRVLKERNDKLVEKLLNQLKQPDMIVFIKKSTRFYVTQSDYDGLVSNSNADLVIECTPKKGNHPKGTYTIPNKIARQFIESKQGTYNWDKNENFRQDAVPVGLEEYFKS